MAKKDFFNTIGANRPLTNSPIIFNRRRPQSHGPQARSVRLTRGFRRIALVFAGEIERSLTQKFEFGDTVSSKSMANAMRQPIGARATVSASPGHLNVR